MKRIIFILCLFFVLSTAAVSAEFYNCVDKDGNSFITDNPPQDAKCKSQGSDDESSSQPRQSKAESQDAKPSPQQQGEVDRLKKMPRQGY
jgi:hypothetical protein